MMKLNKNLSKIALFVPILITLLLISAPLIVFAGGSPADTNYGLTNTVEGAGITEFAPSGKALSKDQSSLNVIAGKFINYVLGIVGTIFLIVILVGGYKWMTASGSEEKIAEGKKMIIQGINGMIAIFLAYALAYVIIEALSKAIGLQT